MKLGVVGKGGVGKTSVTALVAQLLAAHGSRVVAVDTDSNPNLGLSLGLTVAQMLAAPSLPPRLVTSAEGAGGLSVESVLRSYGVPTPAGVTLLSALRIVEAGGGCTCGGHASVRSLLGEALEAHADVTVVDMEAGLEHLSRSGGTLAHADALLVVMEPNRKSVLTAARTVGLAAELGLDAVWGLGNKSRGAADREFFERACADCDVPLAGVLPYEPAVMAADRSGTRLAPPEGPLAVELSRALDVVMSVLPR